MDSRTVSALLTRTELLQVLQEVVSKADGVRLAVNHFPPPRYAMLELDRLEQVFDEPDAFMIAIWQGRGSPTSPRDLFDKAGVHGAIIIHLPQVQGKMIRLAWAGIRTRELVDGEWVTFPEELALFTVLRKRIKAICKDPLAWPSGVRFSGAKASPVAAEMLRAGFSGTPWDYRPEFALKLLETDKDS